jgi:uncharacterized damage-inducible protein DinB
MESQKSFLLPPPAQPLPAGLAFLRQARFRLREDYLFKIRGALEVLSDEQVWWRPNEASNSAGNLLLHLEGNVRQWVIAGVGGAADIRDRQREFACRAQIGKAELLARLEATLAEADAVMDGLESEVAASQSDGPFARECCPQGFPQTVFDALFHVVEHFSYHTGQIVSLAKFQVADQVRFYDDRQLAGKSEKT